MRECTKTYMTEHTRKRDTVMRRLYEVFVCLERESPLTALKLPHERFNLLKLF